MQRTLSAASLLLALFLAPGSVSATSLHFSTGEGIEIEGTRVVITPSDAPPAEISAAGELRIDGRVVAVREKDRLLLQRYNHSIHSITMQAVDIGMQGASIGFEALGAAVVALVTGDGEHAKRTVEPRAEKLKVKARALCNQVKDLRRLQDDIADNVPAFRPYALMDEDDRPDCRIDD